MGINLKDGDGNFLYPRTFVEMIVRHSSNESLATILGNLSKDVVQAKADVDTFLSDFSLSKEVRTALIELRDYLESDDGKITEQLLSTINDLKDNAVKCPDYNSGEYIGTLTHGGTVLYPFTRDDLVFINSIPDYASLDSLLPRILTRDAQTLSLEDKQQARTNVGSVGVKYTDNRGSHLEQAGTEIMPYTKAGNVEYRGSNLDTVVNVLDERSSETKEKVDTFLADADTSEQALDKLKELQDYIKRDETSASQMLGDIAQNKKDIAENATNIEKEATRAKQTEMYLESQKANKYGYYENLSVGVSDNLSGRGEATESEFSFRPSGGENKSIEDGTARINSIKGNSVAWNQLSVISSTKFTIKNDTDKEVGFWLRGIPALNGRERHKLYVVATNDSDVYCYINLLNTYNINTGVICEYNNTIGSTPGLYCLIPPNTNKEITVTLKITDLTQMFNGVNVPTTVEEFEALYGNMPNEHNEGTIIDNHTSAIKSIGVNAWDEEWIEGYVNSDGIVVNGGGVSIMSKGYIKVCPDKEYYCKSPHTTNIFAYDDEYNFLTTVYNVHNSTFHTPTNCRYILFTVGTFFNPYTPAVYNHDICIHLVRTGYLNGKYFPYESQTRQLPTVEGGLKSAGTAYDEIRYNKSKDKWEHVQRIGSVDLGKLEWIFIAGSEITNNRFVTLSNLDNAKSPAYAEQPNVLCAKYKRISPALYFEALYVDLGVGIDHDSTRVILLDKQYNYDAVSLKASLQGVILYYELATPIVTELDVDISPDYKVWDYGTEEAISEVLSTPVRINANYGFNAVGQITDNTELIEELLARVAVLEAQIAQANSANVEPIVE